MAQHVNTEKYDLKEPIEKGNLIIDTVTISHRPKAKYLVQFEQGGGLSEKPISGLMYVIAAMIDQPMAIVEELGADDFNKLTDDAEIVMGKLQPQES